MIIAWIIFFAAVICFLFCCKAFIDSQYRDDKFWVITYGIQAILGAILITALIIEFPLI